ncbi:hypothetical protein RchiOBHm_Chr2g0126121 [Rosa chinensis]|uniref:Uncharacterized protein n=1 Tax=Rosa chinensis TaxID=74649 RepID=A0A2P6RTR9_ROSCH|nr:hypothetical protein RchiOBHm_Chr2g0126121 [Rosa chinensis]
MILRKKRFLESSFKYSIIFVLSLSLYHVFYDFLGALWFSVLPRLALQRLDQYPSQRHAST